MVMSQLRVYPMEFVEQLFKVFMADGARECQGFLRNKNTVDTSLSDQELFRNMPLGDVWDDAAVASAYYYLRGGQHLVIPPSWETAVREFDEQLDAWAS